jgi:hypothetical protein
MREGNGESQLYANTSGSDVFFTLNGPETDGY